MIWIDIAQADRGFHTHPEFRKGGAPVQADIREFRALMGAIQEAICNGVRQSSVRIESRNFQWNAGTPPAVVQDSITLRVQLGPYRVFEETFTREQIVLGLRDPTVAAYVAAAVACLTMGNPRGFTGAVHLEQGPPLGSSTGIDQP